MGEAHGVGRLAVRDFGNVCAGLQRTVAAGKIGSSLDLAKALLLDRTGRWCSKVCRMAKDPQYDHSTIPGKEIENLELIQFGSRSPKGL